MNINGTGAPEKTDGVSVATTASGSEPRESTAADAAGTSNDASVAATTPGPTPSEPTATDVAEPTDADAAAGDQDSVRQPRSVSVSMRSLVTVAVIVALVAAVAVLGWLYYGARTRYDDQATQLANDSHAEKVALDYAVNAATMDYKDLQAWHVKLVAGTSPELNKKLSDAGTSMEQVLVPLQWASVAQPLVAKVRSNTGGIYVVDSFVSVQTKTIQAPEPLQSTATYSTTIDSNKDWQITDVGGIGSAMAPK